MSSKVNGDLEQKELKVTSTKWMELKNRIGRGWFRFRKNPISLVGGGMVLLVIILAVFAPYVTPFPTHAGKVTNFEKIFQPPGKEHWFGTDEVGRDVFSRVIFGYRISLLMALVVLGISVPFGVALGLIAGYVGGIVETIIMRITDVFLSLPALVMALAIGAAFTPTIGKAMLAVSAIWWTWHCRLVHSLTRSIKTEDFVLASQICGDSPLRIIFKDILPNCASAILVKITLDAGFVILVGAGLSFLGLGVQPPKPGLGTMIAYGAAHLPTQWWLTVFPSLAIFFLIFGFNLLGDGLRDMLDVEGEGI
ncbi:MAG: D,D-dipeptide ABC transporter permease [Spirochaetes bacterium]|nr:MAG: D,D-dipeptide ABC transporter permease [Spirochaetota bacterium]